jgi:uncharacterized protein
MQNSLKIVITGPVGAGKTTFIRSISEIEVVDTDVRPTDETAEIKDSTTVAMDFGRITLGEDMWVHIYGTPGQSRFDFMWELLLKGTHGYVILVPAHLPNSIHEARHIKEFMQQRSEVPFVIGVTHADHPEALEIDEIQTIMEDDLSNQPYIFVNPNEPYSSAQAMVCLIERMEEVIEQVHQEAMLVGERLQNMP